MATNRRRQQNTGYTTREDGTAISIRGAYAEENGKFSEGRFRSFYHVAKRDFNILLSLGLIRSEEWHHTGARFNRSDFYEWSDANEVDYSEVSLDGHFPDGSLAEKYFSNRKAVSALVKESESKPWEYVSENFGHFNIPSFEDYIKAAVEKPDVYSHENSLNYNLIRITGKGIEDYLSAGQKEERQSEHSSISLQGEKAGSAAYRRELHLDVDRKYNRIAIDSIPEDILHEAYENAYADDIKHNSEVEGKITEAHAKNTASDGKEKMLIRIAELMGVEHSDAERRAYSASMSNLAAAGYSWNVQKRQEYDSQIDAVLADIEKKQKDYVKKLIKQGRAERRERIASLPQMFATEKEEMNGRYGWFDANSNYNLPRYYTGVEFKDRRGFNHYNDIKKNSLNIIEVLHDKRDYEIASGPSEEDIKRLRMQKSDATVSDVVSTKDAMLRDELIRRMRESGINVVTNERQAQRALERANNRVKFSGDAPKGVAANPVIYTSYNVDDVDALKEKYPSGLSDKYYHHSTVKYGYQPLDTREGKKERLHIIGRLTTDKVDVLVVENPESDNRTPHITLATAKGIKPVASNFELEKYKDKIQPLDDYVDVTFTNNLRGGLAATPVTTPDFKEWFGDWEKNPEQASKIVDEQGHPLIVEHGTNNDFTEFDINRLGETSHDKGIYGAGFYFATEAPAWLNARNKMKVYLDIKKPFEITASMENDIYTSFSEKLDTPAFRALKLHTFNDKEISVGEYIDVIKAVDDFIEHTPDQVNEQIAQDEELQSYHPKDRLQLWREHEISRRSEAAILSHSWNVIISSMIGSEEFTKAAKESGYDGVIVNRDKDYREYVAFEPNQIKSATENIGTYRRDSNDIRFHKAYHGSGNDFDRFDHSHMGEGEGNQSYGWGTYVTEVEGIGKTYAESIAFKELIYYKGKMLRGGTGQNINTAEEQLAKIIGLQLRNSISFDKAIQVAHKYIESVSKQNDNAPRSYHKEMKSLLPTLKESDFKIEKSPRYLYTVEIPDEVEAYYIDYNTRMSEQQDIMDMVDNNLVGWHRYETDGRVVFEQGEGKIVLNPNQTGADFYTEIVEGFAKVYGATDADERASKFLHDECGITGIKYPADYQRGGRDDKASNYVIFNEDDIHIQNKIKFFKTQAGTAYGFALDGKIFVDTKIATAETPIHEYTHLWAEVLREQNPREWKNIVSLMKGAPEIWNKVVKQYPELHSDDEIADEVLAQYSGKRGYERLMQMQSEGEVSKGALDKLMKALEKLWKKVAEFFSIHYTSKEEVADRVLRDLLSGVNPRQEVEKYLKRQDKQYMKAVERGDEKKVQEIFQKSLRFAIGNGMTPYIAVDGYRGKLAGLARKVKTMDKTAINTAAEKMAPLIPRNAVLVPAPSHKGEATDMLKLAKAISRRRHVEVMDVLKSYERERQYTSKKFGGKAISSDNMGIVAIKDIPEGKIPVVIDNVVSTGNTAEACVKALGFGIVVSLADATTAYKHTASLKSAAPVMRNQAGEVIPLSKRFDLSGAKYIGHAAALQKVDELSLEFSDTREKSNSPVQGLEGYTQDEIKDIVESYVQDILDESDIDATIEKVTVIGSRSRNEAKTDSDLDILLEYSGEDYPEDAMYNLLHDDENPLEIEGLKVDINPINPHYSLSTEEWLARDARWREEDKKKNSINNKKANLMKESIDKPYIIHIGTDDRGIVEGEFHVQFTDDNIKLNFDDISKYLKENGGVMRLMDGKPWFDFYDKASAERFAEKITSIGKNITNTINSKEMEKQNENKVGREPMKKIEVLKWAMNHIGANHGSKALEINFEPDYYGVTIGNNVPALADVQKMCDDLGISRESVQSKGHTIQVQLPKDWPDTIGQEQYIPTGNEMWKRANKEIGSHLGYFVEGYDPGYERGVGKTVFFDDLQKAKDFCDKESQRAKTGVWHEVYEVAHETRTPALYVSSWDNKENKVVDITSDVYKYEESNDKNLNDSILRPDLIKRVGELGIDYTPVGLSKGINIEVENEDGEKKPMTVKFVSVSDKNVMLFANVYDVFDDSKGVSIDELPEYKKATIFESLRATLANGGEKQIVIVQDKADVPSYALPAIINGDFSGIDNEQDEKDIRAFMDKNAGCIYDIQPGSEGFIPFPAFGKGADCETVFIVKPTTPEKLLEEKTTQNVAQKSNEKLSESEVLKGKATVSPDGEVVSMTNDKGEKEDFRHVHGGTHDDPALLYSNTGIDVYFYDTEKKTIENIDNEAGIDNYADRKGIFLVRADEYNEAYYQLEAHDRSYEEGEAAERVYSRYMDCEKENGEKPLYAEVTVLFNGETEKEEMIIKLSNDIDERDDEKVFFNVDGLDGLRKLMSPNNGEDFKIVDQDGIDFLPASTFLGENKQQEKENSKTLAPVIPTNELIEQYNKLKAKRPDAMLLFRTGDFYQIYMDDAKDAAKDLGLTMTKHDTLKEADGSPLRFAAFPCYDLDTYLPKLIRTGHRVAICDQLFNREELQKQAKGRITETVGQSQELSKLPATKQVEKPEQEQVKDNEVESTALFKDKKIWNLVIITPVGEDKLRQVVVPSPEDIDAFFKEAKGKTKDEAESLRNALGEKYLAKIADGSVTPIESRRISADEKPSYVKQYAELMIAKIREMKEAQDKGDKNGWKKPWIGISGVPRSIYGNAYVGANNFLLSLYSEKQNYTVPIFATASRYDDLNFTTDKRGRKQPAKDENGKKLPVVHILKGEHSFPVRFTNVTFVNRETKEKISYKDYKQLSKEEREAYDIKRVTGRHNVFCIEQTNLKDARPELYKKLSEPYTMKDVTKQGQAIDFTPVDLMVAEDLWICPVNIKEGSDRAFFSLGDNAITLPAKTQFFKDEDYYSTMFHEMGHSTGIGPLHNRDFGGEFGSPKYAKEELVAELTAAIVASQQGMSKEIKEESAKYLSSWLDAIEADPDYLMNVLHDVDKASATINIRISDIQEQLSKGIGADYSEIREMNNDLRSRYAPGLVIAAAEPAPESELSVEEEENLVQEESQIQEAEEQRGKGLKM